MTIGGVSGSNLTSSLYNSANVISGLASGLDTEGMIEGLVKGYQTKIQNLTNKTTKLMWKQDAYRSIISKMYAFSGKYASYTSNTNLLSAAFFNNAVKVASLGKNKDAVTASGRTSSDIKVTSVKQLASSARYTTVSALKGTSTDFSIMAEKAVNFSDEYYYGSLNGSLTLTYGNETVSISFDPNKDMIADTEYVTDKSGAYVLDSEGKKVERQRTGAEKAADLKALIEEKLAGVTVSLSNGGSKAASELIDVDVSGGKITFKDKTTGKNDVYISGASGTVGNTLGLELKDADEKKPNSFTLTGLTRLTTMQFVSSYANNSSLEVTLDGVTKTISLPNLYKINGTMYNMTANGYASVLQNSLDQAFGKGKITVTNEAKGGDYDLQLKFTAQDNSNLSITSDVGRALGIGNSAINSLDTSKTLGELTDDSIWEFLTPAKGSETGLLTPKNGKLYDEDGNLVNYKRELVDKDGNALYAFEINGVTIGNYSKSTSLATIMADINNNSEAGVKVTYSQTTRKFTFTTKDTGSTTKLEFDGLAKAIFGDPGKEPAKPDYSARDKEIKSKRESKLSDLLGEDFNYGSGYSNFTVNVDGVDKFSVHADGNTSLNDIVAQLNDMFQVVAEKDPDYKGPKLRAELDPSTNKIAIINDETKEPVKYNLEGIANDIAKAAEVKSFNDKAYMKLSDILGSEYDFKGKENNFSLAIKGGSVYKVDVDKNSTLASIMEDLNKKMAADGLSVDLDSNHNFVIKDAEGKEYAYDPMFIARDVLKAVKAPALPTGDYTAGQDAILSAEVNGEELILTRTSNSFSVDGLTLNLQGTFNDDYINIGKDGKTSINAEATKPVGESVVSFQRSTDSDTIMDAIKAFVTDFNEMLAEIRTQYTTLPYQNSSGKFEEYEPLSDEDRATMTENAIQQYEEKAKQGLLFGDRNLSALYSKLLSVFTNGSTDDAKLRQMGISISYSAVDGSAAITLDENKLRNALENDLDTVADVFTSSVNNGGRDGVMQLLKGHLDTYGSTTGATKGILVQTAGTPLSSMTLMNNTWQTQIDNITNEITKWQDKLSAQVDKYTSMFSKLETLIYQMNSQSSALAGLMGY